MDGCVNRFPQYSAENCPPQRAAAEKAGGDYKSLELLLDIFHDYFIESTYIKLHMKRKATKSEMNESNIEPV